MYQKEMMNEKKTIVLSGPEGNGLVLMGYAKSYAKWLEWSDQATKDLLRGMASSDYEHLLEVFKKHFGEYVNIVDTELYAG